MSHHRIEAKSVCFSYPDGHTAISNISFLIQHGESVGIIGANGAGKSTLLQLLLGLLIPQTGDILIGEIQLTKRTLPLIRQRLGLVFQDPNDQLFMPSVWDDVAFGPRNYKLPENDVRKRVESALSAVDILHLKDRPSFNLSGGEKRAATIASILAMQPDVLIMDEPTAGLDPKARRNVINILNSFEHTKIITSHDLDMIYDTCKRVIVVNQGQITADGPVEKVLRNEHLLESCGLEMPIFLQARKFYINSRLI